MSIMEKFMVWFTYTVIILSIGYILHWYTSDDIDVKQLETHIKHTLHGKNKHPFWIPGTGIVIFPRADGSGIIKIKKEDD